MEETPKLIQVVPRLLPDRCGVSDTALLIADEWRRMFVFDPCFAVLNSMEQCEVDMPRAYCPPERLLEAVREFAGAAPAALLVRVSGYGYSPDGAPRGLVQALEQVKEAGRYPIAVMFDELYATGMPWKKAFWYSHRQRVAVARIANVADLVVTNTPRHAAWLQAHLDESQAHRVLIRPVVSNVGQLGKLPGWADREPVACVFGRPGMRIRTYLRIQKMRAMLSGLGVQSILDIGEACELPQKIGEIPIRKLGVLPNAEVGKLLAKARFGLLAHRPWDLSKSGVFAAFCAYGVVPVLSENSREEISGLRAGLHYLAPRPGLAMSPDAWEASSQAAWKWYMSHDIHAQAAEYARWFQNALQVVESQAGHANN